MRWSLLALVLLAIPAANAIVINEIMYNSTNQFGSANNEWFEIFNNDSVAYDLAGWSVTDPADSVIKGTNFIIEPNNYLIIARYTSEDGGSPCEQNFPDHEINLSLEQTSTNEITAHLANNGLSDENIEFNFYIDGNLSGSDALELASFDSGDVTFAAENLTVGEHIAFVNVTFSGNSVSAELNFSNALPNADVYLSISINKDTNEYWIDASPQNATLNAEVFVAPAGLRDAIIIGGEFPFDEINWGWDTFAMIDGEIDFGAYDLCANILSIGNYNDTNLENNFVCENFTLEPPASQTRMRIKTFTENENYDLNETVFWSAQLFPLEPGTVGNLTINLQKRNSRDSTELLKIENYNISENIILSSNFTIPEDWIEGIYKVRAKFKYSEKYLDSRDSGQFWLNGLKDIGPANITFIKYPSALQFGSFGAIFVKFYAGNYNYDKIRLLAYGSPSQVLRDLNQEGLTTSDVSDAFVAFEIDGVKRGQEVYAALPAFTQQNCDANYQDKDYRIRVRAYMPAQNGWAEITTSDMSVLISGKDVLCVSEAKKSGSSSGRNTVLTKKPKEKNNVLEVIRAPDSAGQGSVFTAEVRLTNNLNTAESFEVYSYIFESHEILTEGGWTGNSQLIKLLEPKESKTINLDNVVKENASLGQHTFRIRAKFGKSAEDADSEIEITAGGEQEAEAGLRVLGHGREDIPITSAAVWRTGKGGNMSVAVIIFILVLMVVVLALIKSK
ncbi:MAG: lamin tail domain-containing protein [DPANN group archaeon]|nr:lamin tail domain-containing protein [DPANN group archaeon]